MFRSRILPQHTKNLWEGSCYLKHRLASVSRDCPGQTCNSDTDKGTARQGEAGTPGADGPYAVPATQDITSNNVPVN